MNENFIYYLINKFSQINAELHNFSGNNNYWCLNKTYTLEFEPFVCFQAEHCKSMNIMTMNILKCLFNKSKEII